MIHIRLTLIFFLLTISLSAQDSVIDYGKKIYTYIVNNNLDLTNEFVNLQQYSAFVDELANIPDEQKEDLKHHAVKSYTEVKRDFINECIRILELYHRNQKNGVELTFLNCQYIPSKHFPKIGMLSCFYIANIPEEEEPLEDAIRFECIKTANGWRILDGFFDDPRIN